MLRPNWNDQLSFIVSHAIKSICRFTLNKNWPACWLYRIATSSRLRHLSADNYGPNYEVVSLMAEFPEMHVSLLIDCLIKLSIGITKRVTLILQITLPPTSASETAKNWTQFWTEATENIVVSSCMIWTLLVLLLSRLSNFCFKGIWKWLVNFVKSRFRV